MLTFISNLFRKPAQLAAPLIVPPIATPPAPAIASEAASAIPSVETARLSLAAILAKFPEDLKDSILQMPADDVTVALPVPTIVKQLPSCSVKMSLASIYRQAPAGVFKNGKAEEKRMVEVPLAEVFKRVRPELLKRRPDQRRCDTPDDGFAVFGDKGNLHALAAAPKGARSLATEVEAPQVEVAAPLTLKMPAPSVPMPHSVAAPAGLAAAVSAAASAKPVASAKPAPKPAATPAPVAASSAGPQLVMPIGLLATNWPEPIKTEVAAMNGATVSLPADDVTAGLAKGRVAFSWGSLRAWTQPAPSGASAANEDTELLLPLRVVAPAFLKHSKQPGQPKKRVEIDEEIPALFHGGNQPEGAATETIEPRLSLAREEPAPVPVSEPAPAAAPVVPVAEPQPVPTAQTVGELFGQPSKTDWTPAEIVQNVATLPGMSGAVVSMREGLLVAQSMPEGLKGEAFAAFLPQVFSRLNQYAGEMSLGEVDELTINAQGARCRLFRLGEVLFAALGRAGEPLPSQALRLCAEQLRK